VVTVGYGDTLLNTQFNDFPSSWGLSEVSLIITDNPIRESAPSGSTKKRQFLSTAIDCRKAENELVDREVAVGWGVEATI
jgi:hypothetical protein